MRVKNGYEKVVHFGDLKDAFQNELGKRVWSEGKRGMCSSIGSVLGELALS